MTGCERVLAALRGGPKHEKELYRLTDCIVHSRVAELRPASVENIARGLAALLRGVLPADQGHVSHLFEAVPPTPCLQVAGVTEATPSDFGDGMTYTFAVEAVLSTVSFAESQIRLLGLIDEVAQAVESDNGPTGALFSRLQDDNTVLAGQPAAALGVGFQRYLGQGKGRPEGSTEELLIGTWEVQVWA